MPPRRSARLVAAAEAASAAFPQLPHAVALRIFESLPADARLRCAEVSRGWRATVGTPSLWRRVDLSPASGVAQPVSLALVRAVAAKARGALETLDANGCDFPVQVYQSLLVKIPSLAVLHVNTLTYETRAADLLRGAPSLRELHVDITCPLDNVEAILRNQGVWSQLRVHDFLAHELVEADDSLAGQLLPPVLQALADASVHPSLSRLHCCGLDFRGPGMLHSFVDGVVARRLLRRLVLEQCPLAPDFMTEMARAVRDGALTELKVIYDPPLQVVLDSAAALTDALRSSRTITTLMLGSADFWTAPAAGAAMLDAVARHPTLNTLELELNLAPEHQAAAGAAIAALVAADAPALTTLDLYACRLGDAGLAPILEALLRNTHLHMLSVRGNGMTADFARQRLLPAVVANTSLRTLQAHNYEAEEGQVTLEKLLRRAERIVTAR